MACTVTWTLADLASLEDAIKDGVLEARVDDKLVRYRTLKEMWEIRARMRASLCGDSVDGKVAGRFGKVFANTNKGLC